ncbi:MAG: ABC transporter ATP-binding protein [Actinomycetota bacterium]|nr:ABC transporter ATP-binding protein [Actinomycetota bacterium]
MTSLTVQGLTGGYGKVSVLHDVSVTVGDAEIVAVVGPNGAGKSTLVKGIMRLLRDVKGSIRLDGVALDRRRAAALSRLGVGYVPQGGNTFPDLSVEENLRVAIRGAGRTGMASALGLTYERFPALAQRRRQQASTLSGGERQMLALGAAMAIEPDILVLDEPTTGLAPTIVHSLSSSIREFKDGGTSILWVVEENPMEILKHCDRVYLMNGGVVHRELEAGAQFDDHTLRQLFFGVELG